MYDERDTFHRVGRINVGWGGIKARLGSLTPVVVTSDLQPDALNKHVGLLC